MLISDILKYAMIITNTPMQKCAAALGLSPQNFGQRLRRDTLNLKQLETALLECGAGFRIGIYKGKEELFHYECYTEEE